MRFVSIDNYYALDYRKEVGLTKFIPKAVLENMKVRFNYVSLETYLRRYAVVLPSKIKYCSKTKLLNYNSKCNSLANFTHSANYMTNSYKNHISQLAP